MGAVRTKLESFKRPAPAKVMGGSVHPTKYGPPKSSGKQTALNPLTMARLAMTLNNRDSRVKNSQASSEILGQTRQGTMDRDADVFQAIDMQMADVDNLLQSLGAQ